MNEKEQFFGGGLLSKMDFGKLAEINDTLCVSIYIPTSRAGREVDRQHGQLKLKNSLKQLRSTLNEHGLKRREIDAYLEPAEDLQDDHHFWRNQSDCLVILLHNQPMKHYAVPARCSELTYVSDHFYLLPLFSLFEGDGKFFLLNLSLDGVKFYEGTRHSITEVFVEDLVPARLEEVVGTDYHEKSLQFRSGQGREAGAAMFHGQGAGKDDREAELEKFLRAVDKGLVKLINGESAPLILACVEHYYPVYKKVTGYGFLSDWHIAGNHEGTDPYLLHEMAWPLVEELFQQDRTEAERTMQELSGTGKTSFDLNEIIPAALEGRIEALFVDQTKDRYGLYDEVNSTLIIDDKLKLRQASLYNLAAVQTWLKGGRVFLADTGKMPYKKTGINALFRY